MDETWRLYSFFKDEAVFLDIETSGLGMRSYVTVVGIFDGITTKSMIRGINLNIDALRQELFKYRLMVTFNGTLFDLPFLAKRYPGLVPPLPHIDLRMVCRKVGLNGGLKNIERELGIKRKPLIEHLYGGDALLLWRKWLATGDEHFLNLLVEYNEEDCINLKKIADYVVKQLENNVRERYFKGFK